MTATAAAPRVADVHDLDHDGRGVARVAGKATFIAGALPGERVQYRITRRRRDHDEAEVTEVVAPSAARVEPRCRHFGRCGGCALQHLAPEAQLAAKQSTLLGSLARIGKVEPARVLEPLTAPVWGYRRRARLGAHLQRDRSRVAVGFRGRTTHRLIALERCEVLDPSVATLLRPLGELLAGLSIADRVPQVEVAVGAERTVLVLRTLVAASEDDRARLRAFGAAHGLEFWLQPGSPATAAPLDPPDGPLTYALGNHAVTIEFAPTDFVQVNGELNARMVDRALELLDVQRGHRVLDLFAGLGNFTLPLARRAAAAVGVEGEAKLVARARDNARRNGIGNAEFHLADLFQPSPDAAWARGRYDRLLLDPPRAGAREALSLVRGWSPGRIVYVSCHPGTLARDAGILVRELGYRLEAAGVLDMFPHTAHVESMAVFAV
jgi:23S rRNA (uracil1939-C5)-methyltransferase